MAIGSSILRLTQCNTSPRCRGRFIFEELYRAEYGDNPPTGYFLGYKVAGYSAGGMSRPLLN